MWSHEQLDWGLSEVADLVTHRGFFDFVDDFVDIHGSLIREVVEHVVRLDSFRTALLETENEVHPLVKVRRDDVGFERFAHGLDENVRGVVSPGRELYVIDAAAVLSGKWSVVGRGLWGQA